MINDFDFTPYFHSPEILANKVLDVYFDGKMPSFPVDPFKILKEMNVIYQFRDFKELEGIYLVPEDNTDIPLVGININRPIARQRFSAAHELCHHIKDKGYATLCPINSSKKDAKEKYADKFASELLMPKIYLKKESDKYLKNDFTDFDNIIYLSDYFGVNFEATVFALAYKLNRIEGSTDSKELKSRIRKYKPDKKRLEKGLDTFNMEVLRQIIDSYQYFFYNESKAVWYKFKNDFIYNENRIEGIHVDVEDISEILTDLRINKQESEFCKSQYQDIIEIVGHASLYDHIFKTEEKITAYKLLNLNRMLYQFAPYPEEGGKTRNTNNLVLDAKFETIDWREIPNELKKLDDEIQDLIIMKDKLTVSQYVDRVVKIHHIITGIHPFGDGNGRVSRVMLNWLFKLKGLPPVYLKYEEKELYYEALKVADLQGSHEKLSEVFYREMMRTMIQLNSKFIL